MELRYLDTLTMSVEEAGKLLGIGRPSAYGAVRRGELPSLKIGRRILVPRSARDPGGPLFWPCNQNGICSKLDSHIPLSIVLLGNYF